MHRVCLLLINKVQHIRVLRQSTGSGISSITRMHCGTLMNTCRGLTWNRSNCWIKLFFLFFRTKRVSRFVNSLFPPCLVSLLFTHVWVCASGRFHSRYQRYQRSSWFPSSHHHHTAATHLRSYIYSPLISSHCQIVVVDVRVWDPVLLVGVPASCSCLMFLSVQCFTAHEITWLISSTGLLITSSALTI